MTGPREPLVLDLHQAARTMRLRWRRLVFGLAIGALIGAGILFFVPPWFTANALLLIRTESSSSSSALLSQVTGGMAGGGGSGGGGLSSLVPSLLGSGGSEQLATEVALLQSRDVLGLVVDSLRLQVVPKSPGRTPPIALVDSIHLPELFKPFTVTLDSAVTHTHGGTVWASHAGVGASVELYDREDAIDDVIKHLSVKNSHGDGVEITYRGRDSVTAAQVPNLMSAVYMVRRKTVDRGLNQRRLEFLEAKADTVRRGLDAATDQMARIAEANTAGASAEIAGKALADQIGIVEGQISEFRAEGGALDSLIIAVRNHTVDERALAGFPDLLKSPALNEIITSIAQVETQRTIALARSPSTAPAVMALARVRDSLTATLMPIASAFHQSVVQQQRLLEQDRDSLNAQLKRLPGKAAAVGKQQAEVTRLAQLNMGMGAEVLQARLAAMREGGVVRLVDPAMPQRRESFPRPAITMAVCLFVGLLIGLLLLPVDMARAPAVPPRTD